MAALPSIQNDPYTHQVNIAMQRLPEYPTVHALWATLLHDLGMTLPAPGTDRDAWQKGYAKANDLLFAHIPENLNSCTMIGDASNLRLKPGFTSMNEPHAAQQVMSAAVVPIVAGPSGRATVLPNASSAEGDTASITVTNAWSDTFNGAILVHDTISVTGGSADTTLTARQFALTMSLANGARKTYFGLTQAAPTYQKINPLGSTTMTAYEVAPKSDLGGLGSIVVPSHGNVTVTVTFVVPDALTNSSDNRSVVLR